MSRQIIELLQFATRQILVRTVDRDYMDMDKHGLRGLATSTPSRASVSERGWRREIERDPMDKSAWRVSTSIPTGTKDRVGRTISRVVSERLTHEELSKRVGRRHYPTTDEFSKMHLKGSSAGALMITSKPNDAWERAHGESSGRAFYHGTPPIAVAPARKGISRSAKIGAGLGAAALIGAGAYAATRNPKEKQLSALLPVIQFGPRIDDFIVRNPLVPAFIKAGAHARTAKVFSKYARSSRANAARQGELFEELQSQRPYDETAVKRIMKKESESWRNYHAQRNRMKDSVWAARRAQRDAARQKPYLIAGTVVVPVVAAGAYAASRKPKERQLSSLLHTIQFERVENPIFRKGVKPGIHRIGEGKERMVRIRSIVSPQWGIDEGKVRKMTKSAKLAPPVISHLGHGVYVLKDGNHRVNALLRQGKRRILARVQRL